MKFQTEILNTRVVETFKKVAEVFDVSSKKFFEKACAKEFKPLWEEYRHVLKQAALEPADCIWLVEDEEAAKKTSEAVNMFVEWNKSAELNRRPAASLLTKLAHPGKRLGLCCPSAERTSAGDCKHYVA